MICFDMDQYLILHPLARLTQAEKEVLIRGLTAIAAVYENDDDDD
jgi:hypothetical protein